MPLTRDFKATVRERAQRDSGFRAALYQEAVQAMLDGDFPTARILLRDFTNATIGFSGLADRMGVRDKSLMRMFGPRGNPRAENLLAVVHNLQFANKLTLSVRATPLRGYRGRGRTAAKIEAAATEECAV